VIINLKQSDAFYFKEGHSTFAHHKSEKLFLKFMYRNTHGNSCYGQISSSNHLSFVSTSHKRQISKILKFSRSNYYCWSWMLSNHLMQVTVIMFGADLTNYHSLSDTYILIHSSALNYIVSHLWSSHWGSSLAVLCWQVLNILVNTTM